MKIALLASVFTLFALGAGTAHAETLDGTLKKIKETGSITLGIRES